MVLSIWIRYRINWIISAVHRDKFFFFHFFSIRQATSSLGMWNWDLLNFLSFTFTLGQCGICSYRFKADSNRHLNRNFLVKIILASKIGWGQWPLDPRFHRSYYLILARPRLWKDFILRQGHNPRLNQIQLR